MSLSSRRLPFTIAAYSSQMADHRAESLETLDANRGWQTIPFSLSIFLIHTPFHRNPEYPQSLVLFFKEGYCTITELQILCHETKIPSSMQIDIGTAKDGDSLTPESFTFRTVGFSNFSVFDSHSLLFSYTVFYP